MSITVKLRSPSQHLSEADLSASELNQTRSILDSRRTMPFPYYFFTSSSFLRIFLSEYLQANTASFPVATRVTKRQCQHSYSFLKSCQDAEKCFLNYFSPPAQWERAYNWLALRHCEHSLSGKKHFKFYLASKAANLIFHKIFSRYKTVNLSTVFKINVFWRA